MAGCIVLSILVNILLILGGEDNTPIRAFINTSTVMSGTGSRWRRTLTIPWLVFYGAGIIISLSTHLHFTSKCWREEKVWKASLLVTVVIPTHTGVVCVNVSWCTAIYVQSSVWLLLSLLLLVDRLGLSLPQLHLPDHLDLGLARGCPGR